MNRTIFAIAVAGVLASGAAIAAPYDSSGAAFITVQYSDRYADHDRYGGGWDSASINEREARISARIRHGINDGSLNRYEARRLYGELGNIKAKERSFRSDGRLDRGERAELNRDLDRLAADVWRERHDRG